MVQFTGRRYNKYPGHDKKSSTKLFRPDSTYHFPFSGRSGQRFDLAPNSPEHPLHLSFGTVCYQDPTGFEGIKHFFQLSLLPHSRLLLRSKSIKIDQPVSPFRVKFQEVPQNLVNGKIRSQGGLPVPTRPVHLFKNTRPFTAHLLSIIQFTNDLPGKGIEVNGIVVNLQTHTFCFHTGKISIEPSAKAYLQQPDLFFLHLSQSLFNKDMTGFLNGSVPGMIMLFKALQIEGMGTICCQLHFKFLLFHFHVVWLPSRLKAFHPAPDGAKIIKWNLLLSFCYLGIVLPGKFSYYCILVPTGWFVMAQQIFQIEEGSDVPKYKQLIQSVYYAIENKQLQLGDKIPSINFIAKELSLSRDTVLTAFNELRTRGIIASTPGKGYYVNSTQIEREQKIFLLFDELNAFKEQLYNSFTNAVKDKASVDIYFHYFNKRVFKNLILENLNKYTTYVIMPVFFRDIRPVVSQIEQANVYLLDQLNREVGPYYPAVYQNFHKDVYQALESGIELLKKYQTLIMVHPGGKEPVGMLEGFRSFSIRYRFHHQVIHELKSREIQKGELYIVPNDLDLVTLVKESKRKGLTLGRDLGIISYNDTPLKQVVADGVTTISTDFDAMGKTLARMVLNKKNEHNENPASLIIRNSI